MIYFINYLLVFFGLAFCTYLVLNNRYNTKDKTAVCCLSLWSALWLCLLFAAYPSGFEPVPLTTAARTIALIINVWSFKTTIINRCKLN